MNETTTHKPISICTVSTSADYNSYANQLGNHHDYAFLIIVNICGSHTNKK